MKSTTARRATVLYRYPTFCFVGCWFLRMLSAQDTVTPMLIYANFYKADTAIDRM